MEHTTIHLTKKDVRGPDEFIKTSGVVLSFIERHAKVMGGTLALFVVLGVLYSANELWHQHKESKAVDAFFQVKKVREKHYRDFQKSQEELTAGKKDKKPGSEAKEPPFSNEVAQSYRNFVQGYASTQTGVIAAIEASGYLSENGRAQEARDILKTIPEKTVKSGLLAGLYYTLSGRVEADLGQCENAIRLWEVPLKDPNLKAFHPDLLLRSAVCFEKTNQKDKALQNYDRVINDYAQSRSAESAKVYKRLLVRGS